MSIIVRDTSNAISQRIQLYSLDPMHSDFYCQLKTRYDVTVLSLDISSSFLSSLNDLRLLWNQNARKAFSPSCRVEILIICSKFDTAIIPSPGSPVLVISIMALTT